MIIGLTGLAGAGKSTVANHLVEKHGFERVSFAGPLKKMLKTLDPILGVGSYDNYEHLKNVKLSFLLADGLSEQEIKDGPFGKEYRRLLQVLGTDCIRKVDPEFWVKAAHTALEDGKRYVFDDVRFPNEAATIPTWSLWHVTRPNTVRGAHASEQHAGNMGERIQLLNDSTPENLFVAADAALEYVYGRAAVAAKEMAL